MTRDELLAEIKSEIKQCTCFPGNCEDENNRPWKALRAVVELHKPIKSNRMIEICEVCITPIADGAFMHREYPCPTIQAIEKELF